MRYILIALFSIISVTAHASWYSTYVKDTVFSHVKWSQPDDGTSPRLLSWAMKLFLEEGASLNMTQSEVAADANPWEFFKKGEEIHIMDEEFFPYDINQSWYRVKVEHTGEEYDLWGNAGKIKQPDPVAEGDLVLEKAYVLSHESDGKSGYELRFHFGDTYYKLPVQSDKYHGFYTGMPIFNPVEIISNEDGTGRYSKKLYFSTKNTDERLTAESPVMKSVLHVVQAEFKNKTWVPRRNQVSLYLENVTLHLVLDDGRTLTILLLSPTRADGTNYFKFGDNEYAPLIDETIQSGHELLIEERQDYTKPQDLPFSQYTLHNKENGARYFWKGEVYNPSKKA